MTRVPVMFSHERILPGQLECKPGVCEMMQTNEEAPHMVCSYRGSVRTDEARTCTWQVTSG